MPANIKKALLSHNLQLNRITEFFLWGLLLVIPVSYITAAREIFTFLTLGGVIVLMVIGLRRLQADRIWIMWLVFFVVACISLCNAVDLYYSINIIRRDLLKGTLMFFLGLYALGSARALARFWWVLFLGIAIMGVCGVVFFLPKIVNADSWRLIAYGRASSLSVGYGHFATYLSIIAPYLMIMPLALAFRNKLAWLLWAMAMLCMLLSAYFTSSRILWLSIPLAAILFFWLMSRKRFLVAILGIALLATASVTIIFFPEHSHGEKWGRFLQDPQAVGGTAGDLAKLWAYSYDKLEDNPFMGVGFGKESFVKAYPDFLIGENPALRHTHNVFVDYAVQMGIQGALVLLVFLVILIKNFWPKIPPPRGDVGACFRMATLIMIFSFMLRNQVDEYFIDDGMLLFWLLVGLAWATRYWKDNKAV